MKTAPRLLIFIAVVAAIVFGFRHLVYTGAIKRPSMLKTVIPIKAEEINAAVLAAAGVKAEPMPTDTPVPPCVDGNTRNCIAGPVIEAETWAWNANLAWQFATGGASAPGGKKQIQTSKDSLMAKYGVNMVLTRQDDTSQMQADLISTAQQLAVDPNAPGVKFITIMGDGAAAFMQALNPKLAKICPDCTTKIVAEFGYSRGEDGFWGKPDWKADPQNARGALILGVLRDGDWNIAMKWAAQNGIPNNPDDTVYDPDAINWVNTDSYTKAAEMYVAGYCSDLPVKGKLIGKKTAHVCADGVVTWTPGDVTIAKKRGGLVPIMTTREAIFQMPCVLVGIDRWMKGHRTETEHMIKAALDGADQVRSNPMALQRASEIAFKLYGEESPAYWLRYYKGVTEKDAHGVTVPLGGSAVSNLADNLQAFGIGGGPNIFGATYTTFGKIVVQQYPRLVPDFPPVNAILDTSYISAIQASSTIQVKATDSSSTMFATAAPMSQIAGKRNYAINFRSGSAEILPDSYATLNQIADDVLITKYVVAVHGHTDAQGNAQANMGLSMARAEAVKRYLQDKGQFPSGRIRVYPHGQEEPVADNATAEGRAKNRRVEIVLGTVGA